MVKRLSVVVAVFILLLAVAGGWFLWDYRQFQQSPIAVSGEVDFTIESGDSLRRIASRLQQRNIIRSPHYLRLLGRQTGLASQLKAGEYQLANGMLPQALLELFASGKVKQYAFTIVEGWNFRQLREALASVEALEHKTSAWSDEQIMSSIGPAGLHPEGQFLPDTYHFPRGTTDIEFLQRAHRALTNTLNRAWEHRAAKLPLKNAYEALILASIIEKETAVAEERPKIAGVFVRRLEKGMRLQTDPTVIYGLGADFDGDIRFRDLRTDTPYNTYTRSGLTPTPIAMAGKAAIEAALHPAEGNELYFVARGDGSHYFSATLREHNNAVRKYQLKK